MNAYRLLECRETASAEELKASYHRLLLRVHPDKRPAGAGEDAVSQLMAVSAAYKLLSEPESRRTYDALLLQAQLAEAADQNALGDSSLLSLGTHFELNEDQTAYVRACRCGSAHSLPVQQLTAIFRQNERGGQAESFVASLECDTCSIVVDVLVI
jgi:diphthamide biosynthesis protein 4